MGVVRARSYLFVQVFFVLQMLFQLKSMLFLKDVLKCIFDIPAVRVANGLGLNQISDLVN